MMKIRFWAMALAALLVALFAVPLDFQALHAASFGPSLLESAGSGLLLLGAAGTLKEIRLLDNLGYGDLALSKGDVVEVGRGKEAVDARTAELWVRAGLAVSMDPADAPDPPPPARTRVVVHERGGMELLQGMTTVQPDGEREGPAEENPTDSDAETDAEAGRVRTAAGTVIAENADPEPVAKPAKKGKK